MNKISIIIPTFNDEYIILKLLNSLFILGFGKSQIIVVDGSLNDLTKDIVVKFPEIKYLKNKNSSRATSMNMGTQYAIGDILLFLHSDTFLPENAFFHLSHIKTDDYNYGGFYKKFSPNNDLLEKLSYYNNNVSLSYFHNLLGDNSIFVTRKLFNSIGGYKDIRLMEDVELSKSLKKVGKIKIIKDYTVTSSKKFQKRGVIITILFMQYIRFLYFIGIDPYELEKKYVKF